MPGGVSQYLANKLLDQVLGGAAYAPPATVYIGLWTAALADTSTGSTAGEVSGNGYARAGVTNDPTNWPAAVAASKSNGGEFDFPVASAAWGTLSYFAILDAPTNGNILYWAPLGTPVTINAGDRPQFNAGSLTVTRT